MGQLVNQLKVFVLIRLKSNILKDVCVGGTKMFEKIASLSLHAMETVPTLIYILEFIIL